MPINTRLSAGTDGREEIYAEKHHQGYTHASPPCMPERLAGHGRLAPLPSVPRPPPTPCTCLPLRCYGRHFVSFFKTFIGPHTWPVITPHKWAARASSLSSLSLPLVLGERATPIEVSEARHTTRADADGPTDFRYFHLFGVNGPAVNTETMRAGKDRVT